MGKKRIKKPADFVPDLDFPKNHKQHGKPRCQGWNSNHGRQCFAFALKGKTKCKWHGGASPGGVGSASWKHGRYSKVIPTGLADKYKAAVTDPDILVMDAEIALLQSRLMELVEGLERFPDAGKSWQELRASYRRFDRAQREAGAMPEGDAKIRKLAEASGNLSQVRDEINRGVAKWAAWGEILDLTNSLRQTIVSEQNRRIKGEHVMYVESVWSLFEYIVNLIDATISDPKERAELSEGLHRYSRRMDGAEALIEG